MTQNGRHPKSASWVLVTLAVLNLLSAGCNRSQSTEQALDAQLQTLHMEREPLGKFAGKVTIDGEPPKFERGKVMLVMLYDQTHPEKNKPALYTTCQKDGRFTFYTYSAGDGVPLGSYVVLFAQLSAIRSKGLVQPDTLKNLFDDPDKNYENKDLVVTVSAGGKTDYDFNLEMAGKDPVATPGPHAVTEILKK